MNSQMRCCKTDVLDSEKISSDSLNAISQNINVLPCFSLNSNDIDILFDPKDFYESLINLYSNAQRRIALCALYVGTGDQERNIVETICQAYKKNTQQDQKESSSPLTVDVLIDAVRGTRTETVFLETDSKSTKFEQSSLDILSPLLYLSSNHNESHISNVNVHLFHSPLLSKILYQILPSRINEIMGVFHSKIFLGDDTVILTGANISKAYLTNRQDRYFVIRNAPALASFLHQLIRHLQYFSYKVNLFPQCRLPSHILCDRIVVLNSLCPYDNKDAYLCRHANVPSPISQPTQFRKLLGTSTITFLKNYKTTSAHLLDSQNEDTRFCTRDTTLTVALQIGFSYPAIVHEEILLNSILGPLICLQNGFKKNRLQDFFRSISYKMRHFLSFLNTLELPLCNFCSWFSKKFKAMMKSKFISLFKKNIPYLPNHKSDSKESEIYYDSVWNVSSNLILNHKLHPIRKLVLASGYLNMPDNLLKRLVSSVYKEEYSKDAHIITTTATTTTTSTSNNSNLNIYMASPNANSFYASRGLSKYIPMAYSYIAAQQLIRLKELWDLYANPSNSAGPQFYEYSSSEWTFHSKGIWLYLSHDHLNPSEDNFSVSSNESTNVSPNGSSCTNQAIQSMPLPSVTILGSSNYGIRSSVRDLDLSFCLSTRDLRLKRLLQKEVSQIERCSNPIITKNVLVQRCPLWLQFLLRFTDLKTLL